MVNGDVVINLVAFFPFISLYADNNYWRFRAGQRHGYFPPICPVFPHTCIYTISHIINHHVTEITPGGGGGPRDPAVTGLEPTTTQ